MWDQIDVLLTSDPLLLLEIPDNKTVIKYNTVYNSEIKSNFEIKTLSEFEEIIRKIKSEC